MKVAVVHEYFCGWGGSEAVAMALHSLFPDAPIHTLVANPIHAREGPLAGVELHTSFIQRLPMSHRVYWAYYPLFPLAVEQLDLREYDLVISSSHGWVKNVLTRPGALHICYCHTPLRWAWEGVAPGGRLPGLLKLPLSAFMHYVRMWDASAGPRIDQFVANSHEVARRIRRYYGREAKVVYPPIETDYFLPEDRDEEHFLVVSRLISYKRVDLAIEAFNRLRLPLKVVGAGRDLARLRKLAGPTVEVLGWQPKERVRELYAGCRALVLPGKEDLGMTALEAQSAGRPVIAYAAGGALETVINGVTGLFFNSQDVNALMDAVARFQGMTWDKQLTRRHALRFDRQVFLDRMEQIIQQVQSRAAVVEQESYGRLFTVGAKD